ncbi:mannose-6-phosphate isomerase, class I [Lichtheimia ornata]|uniref:Mannose-6-phosphate isomerase n=1 Tax=Lichtheimia ornata TaxID=688661 RepID=A0AAD7V227_9FUNG|nr:mannose-6-phosphate isomerase, class I [Lichtheimia ornata]KAJ8657385.1 mannose-6-phosphate isomerase, class I [Lichtheimia ornata]
MTQQPAVYRLEAKTQSYDWGKLGDVSKVAHYAKQSGVDVDPAKPYAELWMGTHPNAPSVVMDDTRTPLKDLIQAHSELSTETIYNQYNGDLPFLFKILSIRKALSIQAHPDKALGARLHSEFPNIYKDPNHKPEMAIALTPFEALCGFRPLNEIAEHLDTYPELAALVGDEKVQQFKNTIKQENQDQNKAVLKDVFAAIMNSSADKVKEQLAHLTERLRGKNEKTVVDELVLRLDQQYPGGDIGVFSMLVMNYVTMEPGQAMFLGANEPHAYLSGDCVECMAASDNVVRAGLTPKFKDVAVLVDMLTYRYGSAESQKMKGESFGLHSLLYDPPIDEFSVVLTRLAEGQAETHEPISGPSILIVTRGAGKLEADNSQFDLKDGYVYFVGANVSISATAEDTGLEFYRAFTVPN